MTEIGRVPLAAIPALLGLDDEERRVVGWEEMQQVRTARAKGLIRGV